MAKFILWIIMFIILTSFVISTVWNDQSSFDTGTYVNTFWNGSALVLDEDDNNQRLNCNPLTGCTSSPSLNLSGIRFYYPFEETDSIIDHSGNAVTPTSQTKLVFDQEGKLNKSVYFNGTSYAVMPSTTFKTDTEGTVCMWVKHNSTADWYAIYSAERVGGATSSRFGIWSRNTTAALYRCAADSGVAVTLFTPAHPPQGEWYHICVGSSASDGTEVYINGLVNVSSPDRCWTSDPGTYQFSFILGHRYRANARTFWYTGYLDEFFQLNRKLNSTEVLDLYNNQKSKFPLTGSYSSNNTEAFFSISSNLNETSGNLTITKSEDNTSWTAFFEGNGTHTPELYNVTTLPHLPPSLSQFNSPLNGTSSGFVNVSWHPSFSPNDLLVTYNLSLLYSNLTFVETLSSGLTDPFY